MDSLHSASALSGFSGRCCCTRYGSLSSFALAPAIRQSLLVVHHLIFSSPLFRLHTQQEKEGERQMPSSRPSFFLMSLTAAANPQTSTPCGTG